MIKAIVVEDEFYARKSIAKIINESSLEVLVCKEMESAEDAIDFLTLNHDIQLVLSDIEMAGMDGLGLARYVYTNIPNVYVILITGHEKFEYAREAIKYSVKDYIIKPVFKSNLISPLQKVTEKIEDERKASARLKLKAQDDVYKQYITMKTLEENEDLQKQIIPEFLTRKADEFQVLIFQTECRKEIENFDAMIKSKISSCRMTGFFSRINNEYIYILFLIDARDDQKLISLQISDFINYLYVCHSHNVTAGLSRIYQNNRDLYKAYKESIYSINQRLIDGWNKLYLFNRMPEKRNIVEKKWEFRIMDELCTGDHMSVMKDIHHTFDEIIDSGGSVQNLYEVVISLLKIISDFENRMDIETDASNGDSKLSFSRRYDLYGFNRILDLEKWIDETVTYVCKGSRKTKEMNSGIIEDILNYINRNYYRDITLRELAESKYFMNYSYLSRLFSKKTGKTFSKYLIDYRLEKSKVLLENRHLKVGQVAMEVGYNDVSHYIHTFRKNFKMTPEQYRESVSKEL